MATSLTRQHSQRIFDEQLAALDSALLHAAEDVRSLLIDIRASAVRVHEELNDIRQPAVPWQNGVLAVCFQCGKRNLEVVFSSKQEGYQLCERCFSEWKRAGRARPEKTEASCAQRDEVNRP